MNSIFNLKRLTWFWCTKLFEILQTNRFWR